jgi:hypothetical protein
MVNREEKELIHEHEDKRNVKKLEKTLKYKLRRCEVEAMDKIAEDLEDGARRHNSKILW